MTSSIKALMLNLNARDLSTNFVETHVFIVERYPSCKLSGNYRFGLVRDEFKEVAYALFATQKDGTELCAIVPESILNASKESFSHSRSLEDFSMRTYEFLKKEKVTVF